MLDGKIQIVLADDHQILRHGLRRIVEAEPDMTIVGEAATGMEAVKCARELNPDVVIMDVSMPEQDGLESLREIVKTTSARVLILTVHMEYQIISEAISAGASAYLLKDSLDTEMVAAIRTVMRGGVVFSANASRILMDPGPQQATATTRTLDTLTTREREVFLLLAEGKTPTQVATALFVSPKTVQTHRQHIMEKLGLRTTTDLIRFALRKGLIQSA